MCMCSVFFEHILRKKKNYHFRGSSRNFLKKSCLCAFDFTGTHATCADMHSLLGAVNIYCYSLDVGIPDSVGSSMRMADVVAEVSALAADITFCHLNTS